MTCQVQFSEWLVLPAEGSHVSSVMQLCVNGSIHRVSVDVDKPLLLVLRDDLHLTGAKIGCGEGECGACTVVVDDEPCRSCITPVISVIGKQIRTVEGLAENGRLHPLQQEFLDGGALQCGYCTSGMLMAAWALLQHDTAPAESKILAHMQGISVGVGVIPGLFGLYSRLPSVSRRVPNWRFPDERGAGHQDQAGPRAGRRTIGGWSTTAVK